MKGPKNGIIKASFAGGDISERLQFDCSNCYLLISVGQRYHEGEKFEATLALITRRFREYTIMLCDSLQRHNIAVRNKLSMQDAHILSHQLGDEWIVRNNTIMNGYTPPKEIVRWDRWLKHPLFKEKYNFLHQEYQKNESYRIAIDNTIEEYWHRTKKKHEKLDDENLTCYQHASYNYLIEESAAMFCMVELNIRYDVYPKIRNQAMAATYELYIKKEYKNMLIPVALRFKRYSKQNLDLVV